jgi:hypothetical protein
MMRLDTAFDATVAKSPIVAGVPVEKNVITFVYVILVARTVTGLSQNHYV